MRYSEILHVLGGLLMAVALMLLVAWYAKRRNYPRDKRFSIKLLGTTFKRAFLSLMTPVIIVGGNIDHLTRVMTTAIALETSRGDLALALALGMVLLLIALAVNGAVSILRGAERGTAHA